MGSYWLAPARLESSFNGALSRFNGSMRLAGTSADWAPCKRWSCRCRWIGRAGDEEAGPALPMRSGASVDRWDVTTSSNCSCRCIPRHEQAHAGRSRSQLNL
jgi:hypothetical protein